MTINIQIRNIVALTDFKKEINLQSIFKISGDMEYYPEQFPGLIWRMENPKVTFLLFSSGKVLIMGVKSIDDIEKALFNLSTEISYLFSIKLKIPNYEIKNIVINCNLQHIFKLEEVCNYFEEGTYRFNYDRPRSFVYFMEDPKATLLLSRKGKITSVGNKDVDNAKKSIMKFIEILKEKDIL